MKTWNLFWVLLVFFSGSALVSHSASATLGKPVTSVKEDMRQFSSAQTAVRSTSEKFTVHEIDSQFTEIKEFADSNGVVFAVSWKGTHHPSLSQLFGDYFRSYKAARAQTPPKLGRAPLEVKSDDIVVILGGRMRQVFGLAYVPKLMPVGVSVGDLK